jgi:hypothetical protein
MADTISVPELLAQAGIDAPEDATIVLDQDGDGHWAPRVASEEEVTRWHDEAEAWQRIADALFPANMQAALLDVGSFMYRDDDAGCSWVVGTIPVHGKRVEVSVYVGDADPDD